MKITDEELAKILEATAEAAARAESAGGLSKVVIDCARVGIKAMVDFLDEDEDDFRACAILLTAAQVAEESLRINMRAVLGPEEYDRLMQFERVARERSAH